MHFVKWNAIYNVILYLSGFGVYVQKYYNKKAFFFKVNFKGKADFALTIEVEKGINVDAPINQRIKTIKELSDIVATCRLEEVSCYFNC